MRQIKLNTAPSRVPTSVLIGDLEELWHYVQKKTKVKLDEEMLEGTLALCLSVVNAEGSTSFWVLLPENYSDDTLVHELSHLTFNICKFMNVLILDNSEEFFAYTIEDLFRQTKQKDKKNDKPNK